MLDLHPHFAGLWLVGVGRVSKPPKRADDRADKEEQDDKPFAHGDFRLSHGFAMVKDCRNRFVCIGQVG